jgi:hypothetical protein
MKAIVFSWKDFLEGYEYHNDNLNLGLHEFAHAIHFHGLKRTDKSSVLFARNYNAKKQKVQVSTIMTKNVIKLTRWVKLN